MRWQGVFARPARIDGMTRRRTGWLCVLCEAKGWRAPVFDGVHNLIKHLDAKHRTAAAVARATPDDDFRRRAAGREVAAVGRPVTFQVPLDAEQATPVFRSLSPSTRCKANAGLSAKPLDYLARLSTSWSTRRECSARRTPYS